MKFIMAVCVVAIHTHPLENCDNMMALNVYNSFVTLAVPFFFMASGFFLVKQFNNGSISDGFNIKIMKRHLKKIISWYLLWNIIYFPLAVIEYYALRMTFTMAFLRYIRDLFFVGQHYNSWMLWYLLSTIYTLVFLLYFMKKGWDLRKMLILCFTIFLMGQIVTWLSEFNYELPMVLQKMKSLIGGTFRTGRLTIGFLYIPLGMLIADCNLPILKKTMGHFGLLFAISFTIDFLVNKSFMSHYINIFSTVGLFGIAINIKHNYIIKKKNIFYILRRMSIVIYFIHLWVWTIYNMLDKSINLHVFYTEKYGMWCFLCVTIISVLISLMYILIVEPIIKSIKINSISRKSGMLK